MIQHHVENGFATTRDGKCVQAKGGMVSAAFPEASRAGALMLKKGGNAVDAAAAAAMALCVCEPQACGLGGQTMALIHHNGRSFFLDGSGRVPNLARIDVLGSNDQTIGYKATSVPTTIAVLGYMVRKYGRLSWAEILTPALSAARKGYVITELQHRLQKRELDNFARVSSGSGSRYYLKSGGRPFNPGERFRQPDLAKLIKKLFLEGPEAFYSGRIPKMIEKDMLTNGGFLRTADFLPIPWPVERPVICSTYRGLELISSPPPSAGRSLFLLLKLLDSFPSQYLASSSKEAQWDLANSIRQVLIERRSHPIWPDRYDCREDAVLNNPGRLGQDALSKDGLSDTNGQTTHISAMDHDGNAVALTQSVNLVYASKAAAEGLGFLYNNYLLDCNTTDPDHPHYLHPGNTPASFVAPLFVFNQGAPWLVVGSPGSERIISTVAQFIMHIVDAGLPICQAMQRPRLHYSPEGILSLEAGRFKSELVHHLGKQVGDLSIRRDYSFYLGAIHAALCCMTKNEFQGVAEVRRDGIAAGPERGL
jgi:gamma-glutamyltranspeptidase/glutathione hydrolase